MKIRIVFNRVKKKEEGEGGIPSYAFILMKNSRIVAF